MAHYNDIQKLVEKYTSQIEDSLEKTLRTETLLTCGFEEALYLLTEEQKIQIIRAVDRHGERMHELDVKRNQAIEGK